MKKLNQTQPPDIISAMNDPELFGPWFAKKWLRVDSWATWRVFLKALYGLPMTAEEFAVYRKHTGRTSVRAGGFTRAWLVVGRRGGKSRIAALIAVYNAVFVKYDSLQRGEIGVVPVIAADRHQATVIFAYITNFFRDIPLLAKMVVQETKDSLWLSNNIRIEIQTSDHRSVRGFTVVSSVCDELAFWPTDEHSVSPDTEVLNALGKGSANVPNAMQLAVSSPYSRQGALFDAYDANYAKDTDELCWMADSKSMNPTLSQRTIDKDFAKDPQAAAAEYGFAFRSDLANFLTPEAIAACVFAGRYELAPRPTFTYYAFCDPSGGSSDSMTLAIAHQEHDVAMLDMVREVIPPFVPEAVTKDFVAECKRYHCYTVVGDRYAAEWVSQTFSKFGVTYQQSEKVKSDIYLSLLPAVNSKQVELLDNKKLISQLGGLERRTRSGGKDSVDHRPGLHDDVANAASGALVLAGAGAGVYGLLDYDAKLTRGEVTEQLFGTPGAPPRAKIVQGEAIIVKTLRSDGAVITSTEMPPDPPPAKVSTVPCVRCASTNVVAFSSGGFRCEDCGIVFSRGITMRPFDRTAYFASDFAPRHQRR